jgi:hypothetical protein
VNVADDALTLATKWDLYDDDDGRLGALAGSPAERERVLAAARRMVDQRARNMEAQVAPDEPSAVRQIIGRTAAELLAETPDVPDWDIPGVSARGWLVKLAAREKVGKGTLIFYLVGCLERGTSSVFGPSRQMTSVIYTEEPPESVREKVARSGLQRARIIYGWEMAQARILTWEAKVDYLVWLAEEEGHGALFVDNISRAANVEDEAGVELARRAEYLGERAKAVGVTAYIDHHHKKGASSLGDKSRGGTALAGACDNNVEMVREGQWMSRVRALSSRGRLEATIWERKVALTEDGTGYEEVAGVAAPQSAGDRKRLRALVAAGDEGTTAAAFASVVGVSDDTARRVLPEFVEAGWAALDDEAYPARWTATAAGLAAVGVEPDDGLPL